MIICFLKFWAPGDCENNRSSFIFIFSFSDTKKSENKLIPSSGLDGSGQPCRFTTAKDLFQFIFNTFTSKSAYPNLLLKHPWSKSLFTQPVFVLSALLRNSHSTQKGHVCNENTSRQTDPPRGCR